MLSDVAAFSATESKQPRCTRVHGRYTDPLTPLEFISLRQDNSRELHPRKRLLQIANQVLDIFNPDRKTHHAIGQSNRFASSFTDGRMCHARRMRDERL